MGRLQRQHIHFLILAAGCCVLLGFQHNSSLRLPDKEQQQGEAVVATPCDTNKASKSVSTAGFDEDEDIDKFYIPVDMGYPPEALSIKDLDFCRTMFYGGPQGWTECAKDSTCYECLGDEEKQVVARFKGAAEDADRMTARRAKLKKWFGSLAGTNEPVILTVTDSTYANFSMNLLCSCERNNIPFKHRTLLIGMDPASHGYLSSLGFYVINAEVEYDLKPKEAEWKTFVYQQSSKAALVVAMLDLVSIGVDVIMADADVVFLRDPGPWLVSSEHNRHVEVNTMLAPRGDAMGPGNSGFIFTRSTPRTKVWLQTFQNAIALMYFANDQKVWNSMLRHYLFRQLVYQILPRSLVLDLKETDARTKHQRNPHTYVLHAYGQMRKRVRMEDAGVWYYDEQCSVYQKDNLFTAGFGTNDRV